MGPADSRRIPRVPRYSGFHYASHRFAYAALMLSGRTFQSVPLAMGLATAWSYNPVRGSSPFARHYWGNHCYFLFLQVLRCFSSLRWPPALPDNAPSARWVVPFGDPRVKGHLHLTAAFRSLSRPSSPPGAKASTRCPYLLFCRLTVTCVTVSYFQL